MTGRIIALHGLPGCGKSTVRQIITHRYGFVPVRVAATMKNMVYALGLTDRHIEGDLKEIPCDQLGGATPRKLMQVLGRDVPEAINVINLWPNDWYLRAEKMGGDIIVEDHRYPNEIPFFNRYGPTTSIKIVRPDNEPDAAAMTHKAETQVLPWDYMILNNGTIEQLEERVIAIVDHIK